MDMESDEVLKPRPYQDQLEDIAIKKNTIIHLPTGKYYSLALIINMLMNKYKTLECHCKTARMCLC